MGSLHGHLFASIDKMVQKKLLKRGYSETSASIIGFVSGVGALALIAGFAYGVVNIFDYSLHREERRRGRELEKTAIEYKKIHEESRRRLEEYYKQHPEIDREHPPLGAWH